MANFNRVIIIGNLTRDPEYRQLGSGQAVAKLGIASNRSFRNRQSGDMVQEVCYIDIDVWGPQAESCRQYLQKGRSVLVEGRLKLDTWADANGQNRSKHLIVADRVVFLSGPASEGAMADQQSADNEPVSQMERDIFSKIDEIKNRAEVKPARKPAAKKLVNEDDSFDADPTKTGDLNFKDEPPFSEELPF